MKKGHYLFTSECVSPGHPDKVCDQISDAVLDLALSLDKNAHVACESFVVGNFLTIGGEYKFSENVEENKAKFESTIEKTIRDLVKSIGYDSDDIGFNGDTFEFVNKLHAQSEDIAQGVEGKGDYKGEQGAGDQGIMFGYANSSTQSLMPLTISLARKLILKQIELKETTPWMRPDAKSQVTVEFDEFDRPIHIDTVVFSQHHSESISIEDLRAFIKTELIDKVLSVSPLYDENTKILINPTGRFVVGGPAGDSGLTGRKIIVDTYGGDCPHGGGAFSGKDPSKVDRSAAYMARYIAKNIVASGVCDECMVQLAYAIGYPKPVSVYVSTDSDCDDKLIEIVEKVFDCSPEGIIKQFDLKRPIYTQTAKTGHFGNEEFPWEKVDKADEIKKLLN
ncbi:MAG: methionine adenosyltransferase [Clostridia bacterium]|nr:methionine adenosyltransferase [Clostridia bacterium]